MYYAARNGLETMLQNNNFEKVIITNFIIFCKNIYIQLVFKLSNFVLSLPVHYQNLNI